MDVPLTEGSAVWEALRETKKSTTICKNSFVGLPFPFSHRERVQGSTFNISASLFEKAPGFGGRFLSCFPDFRLKWVISKKPYNSWYKVK